MAKFKHSFLLVFFLFSPCVAAEVTETELDSVLLVVEGEPYLESQFNNYLITQDQSDKNLSSAQRQAHLSKYVADLLIKKEAATKGLTVKAEEVDLYIKEIEKQNGVSRKQLVKLLKQKGMSMDAYSMQVEGEILKTRLLAADVRPRVKIVDEDIQRFLVENPDRLPPSGTVSLEQLEFKFAGVSKSKLKKEVEAHLDRVQSGGYFADGVQKNLQALGYVDPSDLRVEFKEAVENLGVGEVSEIVETEQGFYIFRVAGKYEEGEELDSALKEQIKFELFEARFREVAEKYLKEELPKKYHVEVKS